MNHSVTFRSVATALMIVAVLSSCQQASRGIREVSFKDYAERGCWFGAGEDLEALLVVAGDGEHGERVPWFISSKCIAKEDMPNYGSATLYLLGHPYVEDPEGLLRKHVTPKMRLDNVTMHLPLPSADSPVYYIIARLEPLPGRSSDYKITAVSQVAPTGVRFEQLLEMGPLERSQLVGRFS